MYNPYKAVSKNRGKNPKMDGENHGKPELKMDDLGCFHPYFFGNAHKNSLGLPPEHHHHRKPPPVRRRTSPLDHCQPAPRESTLEVE